jgi:hypothetical protein
MPCAFCKTTDALCFWGPRAEAAWKRPVLGVLSAALASGCAALIWVFRDRGVAWPTLAIAAALLIAGLYSLAVTIRGCDQCVAKLLAEP